MGFHGSWVSHHSSCHFLACPQQIWKKRSRYCLRIKYQGVMQAPDTQISCTIHLPPPSHIFTRTPYSSPHVLQSLPGCSISSSCSLSLSRSISCPLLFRSLFSSLASLPPPFLLLLSSAQLKPHVSLPLALEPHG